MDSTITTDSDLAEQISDLSINSAKPTTTSDAAIIRRPLQKSTSATIKEGSPVTAEIVSIQSLPPIPEDETGKKFWNTLSQFMQGEENEYEFPTSLTNVDRKRLHEIAEEFGLNHFSRGSKIRFITVQKKVYQQQDEWQYFGYAGLFGPSVNAATKRDIEVVPEKEISQKIRRDGPISHITLLSKDEVIRVLRTSFSNVEALMDAIASKVIDDWEDLGLGRIEHDKNRAWFKVVRWRSADDFRKELGLPKKDFHVTVGFLIGDIHGEAKDERTLVTRAVQ
eukprot:TRINITY_DN14454_c0_g1_i1.p1 TRINITY_DN14454_c0_g1~~TRINITY_DN14454_c0_g1_i1.p1  ORF type:complete len:280 (-),score=49.84 TRINITY_DN14454_c0_g1_i1:25-864(-)